MLILSIRTDKPEAELGLYDGTTQLAYQEWRAHRQLAETLHRKIHDLLAENSYKLHELRGIVCFAGPGSFTGLRIGLSVANSLAYALETPVVGATGGNWQRQGLERVHKGENDTFVVPQYGADVHITEPKN